MGANIDESEYEKALDEIDCIEHHFKMSININTQDEKDVTQIDRRSINNYNVLYLLRNDNHFCYIKKMKFLYLLSSVHDVVNYGLIVLLAIDTKKPVATSASMNSEADIVKSLNQYLKIYQKDSKTTNFLITLLHMILRVF